MEIDKTKIKSVENITEELLKEYGDRKQKGRLDFVYDVNNKNFYPVPKNIEHNDYTPHISNNYSSLIPVQLRMHKDEEKYVVTDLLIGASSFEAESGIRHSEAYLKEAYEQSILFLNGCTNVEIYPRRFEIFRKFVKRN